MTTAIRSSLDKFPYTIGVEVTGIPTRQSFKEFKGNHYAKMILIAEAIELQLRRRDLKFNHCSVDGHCIEVASPPFKKYAQFQNWWEQVSDIMNNKYLKPDHPDMVCGGGHIHVGVENDGLRLEIARDICNRPYLPWIFSEPDEEGSCDNLVAHNVNWTADDSRSIILGETPDRNLWSLEYLKDFSVRVTDFGTVEFRFFQAAHNWTEQWDHVKFVLHFMQHRARLYKRGVRIKVKKITFDQMQKITITQVVYQFRKLLRELGLDYSRYQKYVKRNLFPRWEDGRKRY